MKDKNILKFANQTALHNPFQVILYVLGYYIAIIVRKVGFTPNFVSLLSLISCCIAFISIINEEINYFYGFWTLAYILDYVDGTLARMTNKIGKTALRVDHILDHIKILMILLGFGIFYNLSTVWIFCFLSSSLFLFYSLLNHEESHAVKGISSRKYGKASSKEKYKSFVKNNIFLNFIYKNIFSTFFILNGHTLIIFFFLPINSEICTYVLIYFNFLCIYQSILRIRGLANLPR